MRLVAYDKKKVGTGRKGFKKSDTLLILEEFVNSDMDCAKLEGWYHRDAYVCTGSLNKSIERYKIGGVRAVTKDKEVFLVKITDS